MAKRKTTAKESRRDAWGAIVGLGPAGETRILGLDISSTNVGLCLLCDRDPWVVRCYSYTHDDRDTRLRAMVSDIDSWMFANRHLIDGLAYEAPAPNSKGGGRPIFVQAQAVGIVKAAWFRNSNPGQDNNLIEVPIQHGKRALSGNWKAEKAEMIRCAELSYPGFTWNEHTADACGIGLAAYTYLEQSRQTTEYDRRMREEYA